MKKSSYQSAMSKLKTSEDFKERTLERLNLERYKLIDNDKRNGENAMKTANPAVKKNKVVIWAASIAACAVLTLGIYAVNQNGSGTAPDSVTNNPNGGIVENSGPGSASSAKHRVNIDGVIDEVSADGQSFRIGELWVTVTDKTTYGITGPTAPDPSEQLVSKEFKVGNTVSGFTSEDVTSGKVAADVIFNNF
ncbi:hypothetical protein BK133_20070 [Paenibacillus sp. FSL H8-0548]|uniref:hypothetical protein n=1 Tax=Paenibacillus sp. FSL H8-0548 TaxID=1920422 RepID=UPI00096EDEFA|nr:hypothetical protein [Paenibacillus sp. FSL H8-0548]OMF26738.1 hypothetical protein BK133_20070 [Paenibacillus sp. FSL H8-0548]